ncbi:MAG: T9SS type A sorting domain-containing protein [bacterium]|nr:T9SS type A sorting domain-containing protein [bacterium]
MPRIQVFRSNLAAALLVLLVLAAAGPVLAVTTTPVAAPAGGTPWDPAYQANLAAANEAEMKTRLGKAMLAAAAAATPGMADYDVTWYDLVLDLDPVANQLTGTTTVRAVVLAATLDVVDLNLAPNMSVGQARSDGSVLVFGRTDDVLSVTLERTYLQDEVFTIEVDYAGDPAGEYFGWDTYNTQPLIWTLSEPYGARQWWVCKDVNTDKADSVDLHVTVPDPLVVASNGLEQASTVPVAGHTTYHWRHRHPIVTYLVSLAIHPYQVLVDSYQPAVGPAMPILNYVFPAWAVAAEAGYAVTSDMIATFATAFGEYPFVDEKYGHAHFLWHGGMEHQTCSSMWNQYYGEHLIAHELGHQWFGDMITCADFRHIWLNEGFARWLESYWLEQSQGEQAYKDRMTSFRYMGAGTIYVEDPTDFAAIFSADLSYNKASWVVHMLRWVLGEDDFLAGLAAYRAQYGGGSATTEEFQAVMEGVSGLDLEPFIQQWIYGEYYPDYRVSWGNVPQPGGGGRVTVRIEQTQDLTGLFTLPLELRITTDQEVTTHRVDNSEALTWYTFDVAGMPTQVALDPDDRVLCLKSHTAVSAAGEGLPAASHIVSNHPNPFNPSTTLALSLSREGPVEVVVFDAAGRKVRTLLDGVFPAGDRQAVWDGRDVSGRAAAAGVYFARLRTRDGTAIHKMSLVK